MLLADRIRSRYGISVTVLVIAAFSYAWAHVQINNTREPETAVQQHVDAWKRLMMDVTLTDSMRIKQQHALLSQALDIVGLSRYFLDKTWDELSEYDRNRFYRALQKNLIQQITSSPLADFSNAGVTLQLEEKRVRGSIADLTYRLMHDDDSRRAKVKLRFDSSETWRIIDVEINGEKLISYYKKRCRDLLDDFSFTYLVAELGDEPAVILEDFENGTPGAFPPGWSWRDRDDDKRKPYVIRVESGNKYLEATDRGESVIIGKEVRWNLERYRYISFKWRAHRLPENGDERYGQTVDSAAGIYITYNKKLKFIPRSIKYVWSTTLPVGSAMLRSGIGKPWMIVAESGTAHLGEWRTYVFDAYQAYKDTFGGDPPRAPLGIGILSDANSTHSFAYADYDDIIALKEANAGSGVKKILEAE